MQIVGLLVTSMGFLNLANMDVEILAEFWVLFSSRVQCCKVNANHENELYTGKIIGK